MKHWIHVPRTERDTSRQAGADAPANIHPGMLTLHPLPPAAHIQKR